MTIDRAELERLHEKATKGPWESYEAICCPDMGGIVGVGREVCPRNQGRYGHPMTSEDAALIVHLRNSVPSILALLDRALS